MYIAFSLNASPAFAQVNVLDPEHFGTAQGPALLRLADDYRAQKIPDEAFLREADSMIALYPNSRELPALLSVYREAAWQDRRNKENRPRYFLYMARYHLNYRDLGSAIFYYRKALESTSFTGRASQVLGPYIGLTNVNLEFHNLEQAREEYERVAPFIDYVIRYLPSLNICAEELAQVSILLANGYRIYTGLQDPDRSAGCYYGLDSLYRWTRSTGWKEKHQAPQDAKHARFIANKYLLARYGFHQDHNEPDSALNDLHQALQEMEQGATHDEKDALLYVYSLLIRFHLSAHHTDSAGWYIALFDKTRSLYRSGRMQKHDEEQNYFSLAFYADLYEQAGNSPLALYYLRKAVMMQDSIYDRIMTDYNNSLYAKTQLAYDKEQLMQAGIVQSRTRRTNFILQVSLVMMLISGALFAYWYRLKQRQRFVQSKLDMARNIHDEIGPMLLYAKMLLRAEARKEGKKAVHSELEAQISKTLESVRYLAHELKSEEQYTLGGLGRRLQEQLRKNEKINKTRFAVNTEAPQTPLTAYQYHHLVNIFSELISNTIKHASCHSIRIDLLAHADMLELGYRDDGKGFPEDHTMRGGIGLQNVGERIAQLKGRLQIENNFPEGYRILMYIPLS